LLSFFNPLKVGLRYTKLKRRRTDLRRTDEPVLALGDRLPEKLLQRALLICRITEQRPMIRKTLRRPLESRLSRAPDISKPITVKGTYIRIV